MDVFFEVLIAFYYNIWSIVPLFIFQSSQISFFYQSFNLIFYQSVNLLYKVKEKKFNFELFFFFLIFKTQT